MVRLPLEIKELFEGWLDVHFPDGKDKLLNLIRQTRGGKLYDAHFGSRMRGQGVYADLMTRRFSAARERCRFSPLAPLATDLFRQPSAAGDELALFGG